MDMPLLLRIDTVDKNTLEFILGKTKKELERAGSMKDNGSQYFRTMHYTAMSTKKINSFYTRMFASKKRITRRLAPGETVRLSNGEKIGWGEEYPLLNIPYESFLCIKL